MAVHFTHISKTGGSAVKHAIRQARKDAGGTLLSPWGPILGHKHRFRLSDVPDGDKAVLTLRDPISRFVSGFYSRQRKGAPRYTREWSERERLAFEWFATPAELAEALAEPEGELRERAELAMQSMFHLRRRQASWTGPPAYLLLHLDKVLYFARQETLDEDWERLKDLLGLPAGLALPRDDAVAHRTPYVHDLSLSDKAVHALQAWYSTDYEILRIAEGVREGLPPPRAPLRARVKSLIGKH